MQNGLNIYKGEITHLGVSDAFDMPYSPPQDVLT